MTEQELIKAIKKQLALEKKKLNQWSRLDLEIRQKKAGLEKLEKQLNQFNQDRYFVRESTALMNQLSELWENEG